MRRYTYNFSVFFPFLWAYHQCFEKCLTISALKYLSPLNSLTTRCLYWREAYDKNDKYIHKEGRRGGREKGKKKRKEREERKEGRKEEKGNV